jgi:hypothetical protein
MRKRGVGSEVTCSTMGNVFLVLLKMRLSLLVEHERSERI